MPGVERKFVGHVLPGQRLLRAAAHVRLPFFDHAAVFHGCPEMAGIIVRVGILGVDREFHFCREREYASIADRAFGKGAEADAAMHKASR